MKRSKEIISYLFWGVMTTIVSWVTYSASALLLKGITWQISIFNLNMPMVVFVSNIISWIFAVSFAFVTNKMWVFQSKSWGKEQWIAECVKFVSARIATGIFEIVAVPLIFAVGINQSIFGVEGLAAKIVISVIVIILNYVLSKVFVFKSER